MKPIINPWWIYLAEKSENIGTTLIVLGVLGLAVYGMINLFYYMDNDEILLKKKCLIALIVFIIVGSLLPSQKTILTMMTVLQLTPDNITLVGNTVESTIDYIIDKIEDITDEDD